MNTSKTTFWKFLNEHKVEIPIIQRDYAQGRKNKEQLRKKFLADLKVALDESQELKPDNQELKLDFVYGSVENGKLNPLDGQQRLTTLWLLHWYIAYKAGKLSDAEIQNTFKRFTYETRVSSREFCEKLSDFTEPQKEKTGIVEHIQNQTWFYSAWKQDPTIQAMLNMLGGTSVKDKDGDIIDGLEELFKDTDKETFENHWNRLTKNDDPIVFYYLPLNEFGLSDDLYIRMNARGKALTSFENFKADLVGYVKDLEKDKKPQETIAHKLDTAWTDIFWKNKSEENKIDEIYFAFLNRYFLNMLITKTQKDDSAEKSEKENLVFKYLYGDESNDSAVQYASFDVYECFEKDVLDSLTTTLDNFHDSFKDKNKEQINSLFLPAWADKEDKNVFHFIPEYNPEQDKNTITVLTRAQRVVFHAICKYFETGCFEEKSFKQWMRVVWNIVENSNSDSNMTGALRHIDNLAQDSQSHSIYTHLKALDIENSGFASEQMKEEREKACKILDDNAWEEKIIDAEKTAFFKGAIRFMFTNENDEYDWDLFENRREKSKLYFDKNGVKDNIDNGIKYATETILLKTLISYFDYWKLFWDNLSYNNTADNWKKILTNSKWIKSVNGLFNATLPLDFSKWTSPVAGWAKVIHEDLVKSELLAKIYQHDCKLNWRYNQYALYPPNAKAPTKKFVLAHKRNEILSKLIDEKEITSDQKIPDVPYFWGKDLNFKYNETHFQWNPDNKIYLLLNNNYVKDKEKENSVVCISTDDVTENNITDKLNELLNELSRLLPNNQ